MIRLALNQNSCSNLTTKEFIEYSTDFNGIELNYKEIKKSIAEKFNLKDIMETLESYKLKLCSIFELEDFSLCSQKDYKFKVLKDLNEILRFCYKLEADLLVVNPSKKIPEDPTIPKWRILNKTKERLEDIAKIADKEDVNVGFEFTSEGSISNLNEAKSVMNLLTYNENVGYIIDTFYLAIAETDLEQIKSVKGSIFLIQLSDLKYVEEPSESDQKNLKKAERVFPGEGVFETKRFLKIAQAIGYKKEYSIELNDKIEFDNKKEHEDTIYKKFYRKFENI